MRGDPSGFTFRGRSAKRNVRKRKPNSLTPKPHTMKHSNSGPGNLFADIPSALPEEFIQILWQTPHLKFERIVSRGHATPSGQWYDQDTDEWVVLLQGAAGLRIEGRDDLIEMKPGDYLLLPARTRHRVEWTAADADTIWLAIHCPAASG